MYCTYVRLPRLKSQIAASKSVSLGHLYTLRAADLQLNCVQDRGVAGTAARQELSGPYFASRL